MVEIKAFSVPSVICEGWHFTHKPKALAWVWANKTSETPQLFIEVHVREVSGLVVDC
jgi:hypothetical protein